MELETDALGGCYVADVLETGNLRPLVDTWGYEATNHELLRVLLVSAAGSSVPCCPST